MPIHFSKDRRGGICNPFCVKNSEEPPRVGAADIRLSTRRATCATCCSCTKGSYFLMRSSAKHRPIGQEAYC
jgi:hypothetical protein